MTNPIEASIILQMMGRPAEHLQTAAEELILALGKEKGIKITSKILHELKIVENKDQEGKVISMPEDQKLYSTFAEIELEAENIMALVAICFKYMPAHIEITEPENFIISNFEIGAVLNEITAKMHNYDAIAKSALMQNQILAQKFQQMQKFGAPGIKISEIPQDVKEETKNKKTSKKK